MAESYTGGKIGLGDKTPLYQGCNFLHSKCFKYFPRQLNVIVNM